MFKASVLSIFGSIAMVISISVAQTPPECPRGELNSRFCDRDGDMLADPETNPSKWLDPYTLVFGYTKNQALFKGAQLALKEHIEKVTGKKVRFFMYRTNAAQLEAMRNGLLHIVSLNTGSVPIGVRCSGFRLFAMAADSDKKYGYTMQIITYPGSNIYSVADIRDNTVLFVTPTSNSGYKAPLVILRDKYHMNKGVDYRARFSGSHSKSIMSVVKKKTKVATIANGVLTSMLEKKLIPPGSTRIIYTSESFPGTGFGYPYNLKPDLAKNIEEAFFTFGWKNKNGQYRDINKYHDARFIPANYKNKWSLVREVDREDSHDSSCR